MEALQPEHARRRAGVVVVLTGSESTGKSVLARELAEHYSATSCSEYVRQYLDTRGGTLDATDVEPIALGQIALEDVHAPAAGALVIQDADLVSTVVYARHYYGSCPQWIVDAAVSRRADLYLLMNIDIPWVADPQRDRGHMREAMHALFAATLREIGAKYVQIGGNWNQRKRLAIEAIDLTLGKC